jgi:hypothetical protein
LKSQKKEIKRMLEYGDIILKLTYWLNIRKHNFLTFVFIIVNLNLLNLLFTIVWQQKSSIRYNLNIDLTSSNSVITFMAWAKVKIIDYVSIQYINITYRRQLCIKLNIHYIRWLNPQRSGYPLRPEGISAQRGGNN